MIHPLKAHDFTYRGPPLRKNPFSRKIFCHFFPGGKVPPHRRNVPTFPSPTVSGLQLTKVVQGKRGLGSV